MFNHILFMNLIHIKNYFGFLFDLKINIILIIFCLLKLFMRYDINVEIRDINDTFELE